MQNLPEIDLKYYFNLRHWDNTICSLFILFSRLLFTEESVLQHELGRGQLAFKWHKRSKPTAASTAMSFNTDKSHVEQPASLPKKGDKSATTAKDDIMDTSKDKAGTQASSGK